MRYLVLITPKSNLVELAQKYPYPEGKFSTPLYMDIPSNPISPKIHFRDNQLWKVLFIVRRKNSHRKREKIAASLQDDFAILPQASKDHLNRLKMSNELSRIIFADEKRLSPIQLFDQWWEIHEGNNILSYDELLEDVDDSVFEGLRHPDNPDGLDFWIDKWLEENRLFRKK
jgi:hypothetical protein